MFVQKLLHKIWLAARSGFAVCAACNTAKNSVQCNLPETLTSTPQSPHLPPVPRPSLGLMSDMCAQQHGYQVLTSFGSNLQCMTTCQELAAALEAHRGSSQLLAIARAGFIQVCAVISLHKVVLDVVNPLHRYVFTTKLHTLGTLDSFKSSNVLLTALHLCCIVDRYSSW